MWVPRTTEHTKQKKKKKKKEEKEEEEKKTLTPPPQKKKKKNLNKNNDDVNEKTGQEVQKKHLCLWTQAHQCAASFHETDQMETAA